jgi:hypothetical protein
MSQTEVKEVMDAGVEGMLADLWTEENGDVGTATSEEASAEIPFGRMVAQGVEDDGCKLLVEDAQLKGVTVFSHLYAKPTELGDSGLKPGVTFDVLKRGRIIVFPEDAVTPQSEVHVRHTVQGQTFAGAFRGTASASNTLDLTGYARWETSADAGEPAVLWIDMLLAGLTTEDS